MDIFTERISETLKNEKINQADLAKSVGISRQCITDYKSGKSFPSIQTLRLICSEIEISADYLLGLENDYGGREENKTLIKRPAYDIADKQLNDVEKLFKYLTELQKAQVLGYVIAILEQSGINAQKILRA